MEVGVILGCLRSACVSGEDWLEELEEPPVPHLGLQMKTSPPPTPNPSLSLGKFLVCKIEFMCYFPGRRIHRGLENT